MTPEELKDIEMRAKSATPGPWEVDVGTYQTIDERPSCWFARGPLVSGDRHRARRIAERDAEFMARAREDIVNVLAYVHELEACYAIARVRLEALERDSLQWIAEEREQNASACEDGAKYAPNQDIHFAYMNCANTIRARGKK